MKKSIHLTNETVSYMEARADEINFSAAVNAAFEQLAHIARAEMPEMAEAEFFELCNVYAGSDLSRIILPINLARDLLDYHGATVPDQLPGDIRGLANRLATMGQAQQFALLDSVRVFWHAQG